jgi:hypothetical protein
MAVGLFGLLVALVRPSWGFALAFIMLYFPILPNVPFGPVELALPNFVLLGLFVRTLDLRRSGENMLLAVWQRTVLVFLGLAFFLSFLFSHSFEISVHMLPNYITYLLWLYVFMRLVKSPAQLWQIARLMLVLGFLLSIWRIELRPIRGLLSLPSLGINGAIFAFHPSVALSFALLFLLPASAQINRKWQWFAGLTLFSTIYHGVLLEGRAGVLAWLIMLVAVGLQSPTRAKISLMLGGVLMGGVMLVTFGDVIQANLGQTRATVMAFFDEDYFDTADVDDRIRLVARDAALNMFRERPVFGWGPNAYIRYKPLFVNYFGKEADLPGAFNAWAIALAELGLVGTLIATIAFLTPLIHSFRYMRKTTFINRLAFAYALGVLGLFVHLLFIDLMYSFAWVHLGLALAAARLALDGQIYD